MSLLLASPAFGAFDLSSDLIWVITSPVYPHNRTDYLFVSASAAYDQRLWLQPPFRSTAHTV
jgi:hypothetical protein